MDLCHLSGEFDKLSLDQRYETLRTCLQNIAYTDSRPQETLEKIQRLLPKFFKELGTRHHRSKRQFIYNDVCKVYRSAQQLFEPGTLILSVKGMIEVVDYLKEEGSLPFEVIVCSNTTEFPQALDKIKNKEIGSKVGIILNTSSHRSMVDHYISFYLKKKEDAWMIFEMDSLGNDQNTTKIIFQKLSPVYHYLMHESNCDSYLQERQTDGSSCPTYALRDLVIAGRHADIFTYLEEHGARKQLEIDQFFVPTSALPPEMIVLSQNERVIRNYTKKRQEHEETLTKKIEENRALTLLQDARENNFIYKRGAKYQGIVLARLIEKNLMQ